MRQLIATVFVLVALVVVGLGILYFATSLEDGSRTTFGLLRAIAMFGLAGVILLVVAVAHLGEIVEYQQQVLDARERALERRRQQYQQQQTGWPGPADRQ